MLILGLNVFHGDSSAALIRDGAIIAAAEEERFRRIKHWAGFPTEAIRNCLAEGGASLAQVDHIAVNSNPRANLVRRLNYTLRKGPSPKLVLDRLRNLGRRFSIETELRELSAGCELRARLHRVEHHLAHLASCFLVSPFREAVAISVDGFGDFASAAWGVGRNGTVEVDGRVLFPHSLGIFYQAFTQYLGFHQYGDEYKVMGLAPYGKPIFLGQMQKVVHLQGDGTFHLNLDYFRHHKEVVSFAWQGGAPEIGQLYSQTLEQEFGPPRASADAIEDRHRDIACSVQAMYEEAFFSLLNNLYSRYAVDDLTLSGGCAMNSVANGKVRRRTPFRRVYVQPAAGDAGGAIGAAMHVCHRLMVPSQTKRVAPPSVLAGDRLHGRTVMDHAFWGPGYDSDMIAQILREAEGDLQAKSCQLEKVSDIAGLCDRAAAAIADGSVVGWFQGRMEWGPRALGNRSIVCDPRRANMKDILNQKIKRRESFRPFAPSILREYVSDWFEEDADVPFMMQVLQVRQEKRKLIPAVTHIDGSGRLQTVYRETNARYYQLIEKFYEKTSVPMVLNTSFNENEPIVCRPQEALECFLRTQMDCLVMQDWFIQRHPDR